MMMTKEQEAILQGMTRTMEYGFSEAIAKREERTIRLGCPCGGCTAELLLRVIPKEGGWSGWIKKPHGEAFEKAFDSPADMLREMAQFVLAMGWRLAPPPPPESVS